MPLPSRRSWTFDRLDGFQKGRWCAQHVSLGEGSFARTVYREGLRLEAPIVFGALRGLDQGTRCITLSGWQWMTGLANEKPSPFLSGTCTSDLRISRPRISPLKVYSPRTRPPPRFRVAAELTPIASSCRQPCHHRRFHASLKRPSWKTSSYNPYHQLPPEHIRSSLDTLPVVGHPLPDASSTIRGNFTTRPPVRVNPAIVGVTYGVGNAMVLPDIVASNE